MILQYQGVSFASRVIRSMSPPWYPKDTHSSWSFARIRYSVLVGDTSEYEAWIDSLIPPRGKVYHRDFIGQGHTKGTRVDLYDFREPMTSEQNEEMKLFLEEQVGKGYDFKGVFSFLTRKERQDPDKWFCIELIMSGLQRVGKYLFDRIKPSEAMPCIVPTSPVLVPLGYIILGEPDFRVYRSLKHTDLRLN